jgi:diguanylate cyclase (GGDEF)-like protein/PAS domain S-box-containing protein
MMDRLLTRVWENAQAIIYVCDLETNRVLFANRLAREQLRVQEGQFCCEQVQDFVHVCGCRSNELLLSNPDQVIHTDWYNPNVERWYERHLQVVDLDGGRLGRLEITFDVTKQIHVASNGFHQGAYARLILESIGDAVIATDNSGIVTMMNPPAERLTGWDSASAVGKELTEVFYIINTQTRKAVENPIAKVLTTGAVVGLANHTSLISRDGVEYQIADSAAPVKDADGNIHGAILVFRDVTDEYRKQEELRSSEERFRALMETSINAIALHEILTDEQGRPIDYRFLEVNRAFEELTGLSADKLVGRTVLEVMPDTEPIWIETYGEVALTGATKELEDFSQAIGKYFSVRAYSPRHGQFVTVFEDITERKLMENRLRDMVYKDFLTGLHNRRYLENRVEELERDEHLPLSVVIGDVNGLKIINDTMGHQKGDEYLRRAAEIFRQVARPEDLVIRWGGDEFVLILSRTTAQEADSILNRINELSSDSRSGGIVLSIALGCATKSSVNDSLSDILREAETRMYQANSSSFSPCRVYLTKIRCLSGR